MVNAACVRGGVIARQMFIRPCTWDKLISLFNDSGKHATLTDAGPRRERTDGKDSSPNREGKRMRERFAC